MAGIIAIALVVLNVVGLSEPEDFSIEEQDEYITYLQKAVDQQRWTNVARSIHQGVPDRLVVLPDELIRGDVEILFEILLLLDGRREDLLVMIYCSGVEITKKGQFLLVCIKTRDEQFSPWNNDIEMQYIREINHLSLN